jgi:hypothetical protein
VVEHTVRSYDRELDAIVPTKVRFGSIPAS